MKLELIASPQDIRTATVVRNNLQKTCQEDKAFLLSLSWNELTQVIPLLNPQQYATYLENRFRILAGWNTRKNDGDAAFDDRSIEIKVSVLSDINPKPNIRQVRLFQNIDLYYIFIIRESSLNVYKLSKQQMENEVDASGRSKTHGKKGVETPEEEYNVDFNEERWQIYKIDSDPFLRTPKHSVDIECL